MASEKIKFESVYTITIVSTILIVAHLIAKSNGKELVDPIVIGLLFLSLAPWIIKFVARAELPGGWKIEFLQIKEEQEKQKVNIEEIYKFLIDNFLSEQELKHLRKIHNHEPFLVKRDSTSQFFEAELRKLRSLKLIDNFSDKGIGTLLKDDGNYKNVTEHFFITEKGKNFLKMLESPS